MEQIRVSIPINKVIKGSKILEIAKMIEETEMFCDLVKKQTIIEDRKEAISIGFHRLPVHSFIMYSFGHGPAADKNFFPEREYSKVFLSTEMFRFEPDFEEEIYYEALEVNKEKISSELEYLVHCFDRLLHS